MIRESRQKNDPDNMGAIAQPGTVAKWRTGFFIETQLAMA
jgi:hypothetical protein